MSKTLKDAPPEETPAPVPVVEAEFWSKGGKFRLGDLCQFNPFTPGINNMGKFVDIPNKLSRARDEDEYQLYRGYLRTSDPALIKDLSERCDQNSPRYNPAIRRHV